MSEQALLLLQLLTAFPISRLQQAAASNSGHPALLGEVVAVIRQRLQLPMGQAQASVGASHLNVGNMVHL
jgi:hypothetical protein